LQRRGEPVDLGEVQCLRVEARCSALLQVEKAIDKLAGEPPEVRVAGRDEIMALLKTLPRPVGDLVVRRAIVRLALPDEQVTYTDEHIMRARRVIQEALADCFVCVVTPAEFVEKFVKKVYTVKDRRGRLAYKIIIAAGGDEDGDTGVASHGAFRGDDEDDNTDEDGITVVVPHGAFRRGRKIVVPPELNDVLRASLGVEIDPKMGLDLRTLLESIAEPDDLDELVALRQALRAILDVPALQPGSYRGRWCRDGMLFVPFRAIAHVVDLLALKYGNKRALLKIARRFGVLAPAYFHRYEPVDFDCEKCGYAYVFLVKEVAKLLGIAEREICREI